MSDPAWEEYLAAARRLDALRRGAITVEDEPGRAAVATLEELTRVRARLAAQHTRLRTLGVPEEELCPSPADLAAVGDRDCHEEQLGVTGGEVPVADGPGTVWAVLRRSRALAERADTALTPPRGWAALADWGRALFTRRPR